MKTYLRGYAELHKFLGTKLQKTAPSGVATIIARRGENITVEYHGTPVLTFSPTGAIELRTGGWRTTTTKARMNAYLPAGIGVYQAKHEWYVRLPFSEPQPFVEGYKLTA